MFHPLLLPSKNVDIAESHHKLQRKGPEADLDFRSFFTSFFAPYDLLLVCHKKKHSLQDP